MSRLLLHSLKKQIHSLLHVVARQFGIVLMGRNGWMDGWMREGGREGEREGRREGGKEGRREGGGKEGG